jgi:uncharacterized protein (TIGR03067 family)
MRMLLLTVAVATAWFWPTRPEAPVKDLAALQGTWTLAAMEVDGQEVPAAKLQGTTLTIRDNQYSLQTGKQLHQVEITLRPGKSPKEIDMKFLDGANKDRVGLGIYHIEGDTMKICRGLDPQQERPQQFKTSGQINYFVMVWQRQP